MALPAIEEIKNRLARIKANIKPGQTLKDAFQLELDEDPRITLT